MITQNYIKNLMSDTNFDLDKILKFLKAFEKLKDGWDSYDAIKPHKIVIQRSEALLQYLSLQQLPQPLITPVPNGNIQIEFLAYDEQLEIEICENELRCLYNDNIEFNCKDENDIKLQEIFSNIRQKHLYSIIGEI